MYNYINGKVTHLASNYIVLENNGVGYHLNTPNPYVFNENEDYKVYIYQQVREDDISLYGFKSVEEKELFLKLISVKGLGPKMALPILATGSVNGVKDAIERENVLYLKKFPKIGDKIAKQMILDLKGKLGEVDVLDKNTDNYEELVEVLKGLGYKEKEFKAIIPKIGAELSIEDKVKEALKLLLK